MRWLSLSRLSLPTPGASWQFDSGDDEIGIDILGGVGALSARGPSGHTEFEAVGQRGHPFDGPPTMAYLPRSTAVRVTCITPPLDAVVVRVEARRDTLPRLLLPSDTPGQAFGRSNWSRSVYPCIGPDVDADRLMMGETHSPSGNWSSYPPHKHDSENPPEHVSEEVYHFLIEPPFGFGLQTMWTPSPRNGESEKTAIVVHHGDSVVIPAGYHPVVVAPGFRMITVWAYASDIRAWGAWAEEPRFAGLLDESDGSSKAEWPDDR